MAALPGAQPATSQPQASVQEQPPEVMSTTDALARLRIQHKEASKSSGSTKAPTLQQLESEAAPFEEYVPEVIEAKIGTAGM